MAVFSNNMHKICLILTVLSGTVFFIEKNVIKVQRK